MAYTYDPEILDKYFEPWKRQVELTHGKSNLASPIKFPDMFEQFHLALENQTNKNRDLLSSQLNLNADATSNEEMFSAESEIKESTISDPEIEVE